MRNKKYLKWIHVLFTLVITFSILLTGCGKTASSTASGQPAQKIKINYASYPGDTLWQTFAKDKGFYKELEDAGIDLQTIEVGDKVGAFASGQIDFGDIATTSAIIGAGKGGPFKIVANMYRTKGPFFLIAQPQYSKVEDLKGKTIGVGEFGGGTEIIVKEILKKHGIDPDKDVKLVANGGSGWQAVLAGLEAKQFDATIIEEPFVTLAENKGVGKFLANGWDYLPDFHTGVLVASDKLIKKHPEIVKQLIKFYFDVYTYAKAHKDEWAQYEVKAYNLDPEVEKKALERWDPIWENIVAVDPQRLVKTQEIQKQYGFQDEIYDVNKILDSSFAK